MKSIIDIIQCTPSRRSIKFHPGPNSRHYLAFDSAVSREDRLLLFMGVFACYRSLHDPRVIPDFTPAAYLPEELVEVRVVCDPRHPAFGQAGLYAKRTIATNTIVTPYAGFVEIFGTSSNSRTYTMGFGNVSDDYAVDAEFCGNYGRFANDPRGVEGLAANLSAETKFTARGESYTALVARRQISEGEEILMAYGKAHSLGVTPWLGVRGEALMRRREGSVVPMPIFDGQPEFLDEMEEVEEMEQKRMEERDDATTGEAVTGALGVASRAALPPRHRSPLAYHVMWECTQCGAWNRFNSVAASLATTHHDHHHHHYDDNGGVTGGGYDGTSISHHSGEEPSLLDLCRRCGTPRLSGVKLVALLSSPPLTDRELARDDARELGLASQRHMQQQQPQQQNSAATVTTTPVVSTLSGSDIDRAILALDELVRNGNGGGSHPATTAVTSSPDGSPVSPTNGSPAPQPSNASSSPRTAGSPTSPRNHHHHHHSHNHHNHHYASIHTDWPMNVPFLPWQVWDPAVPAAALERHSRFDAYEHVFIYGVDVESLASSSSSSSFSSSSVPCSLSASLAGSSAASRTSPSLSSSRASSRSSFSSSSTSAVDRPASARGRRRRSAVAVTAAKEQPQRGGRGARRRADFWEKQAADDLPPLLRRRPRDRSRRRHRRRRHSGDANGSPPSSSSPHGRRRRQREETDGVAATSDGPNGNSIPTAVAASSPVHASLFSLLVAPAPPLPPLAATLSFHRDVERFLVLHSRRPAHHHHHRHHPWPGGGGGGDVSGGLSLATLPSHTVQQQHSNSLRSPFATIAASLRRMSRRPFTGKSYRAGETVAHLGGCVRPLTDLRCRPEHSPLAIPMAYLVPAATRRALAMSATQGAATSEDAVGMNGVSGGGGVAIAALEDLVARLDGLCLIVTDEFMYCPVLAPAVYWTSSVTNRSSISGNGASPPSSPLVESRRWAEEADALVRACNLALVLSIDPLGCPHVAAVATKNISAFEALLARVQ